MTKLPTMYEFLLILGLTLSPALGESVLNECQKSYSLKCFKLDAASFVERISNREAISILPGISVVRSSEPSGDSAKMVAELVRNHPNDTETRVDEFLLRKIETFLTTHSIRLKLPDLGMIAGAAGIQARGKKDKGMGQALMAGMMMVKATLMTIGMGALAMLASKALMTGMMALLLSAIIGLKSLTSHGGKSATYEIISKPIVSHAHTHSTAHEDVAYGGYGHGRRYGMDENMLSRR